MNNAFLMTGGNIGDRYQNLVKASQLIEQKLGKLVVRSSIYETGAWGIEDQAPFLNQVIQLETKLTAKELLSSILLIEKELGRERLFKYGPRIIDIDILFYNDTIVNEPDLVIPHPQLPQRRFVLVPLNELIPQYIHPVLHKSIEELLSDCKDRLSINLFAGIN